MLITPFVLYQAVSLENSCSQDTGYQTGSLHTTELVSQLAGASSTASSTALGAPTLTVDSPACGCDALPVPDAAAEAPSLTAVIGKQLTNTTTGLCQDATCSNVGVADDHKFNYLACRYRYPSFSPRSSSLPLGPSCTASESCPFCSRGVVGHCPLSVHPPHVFRLFGASHSLQDATAAGERRHPEDGAEPS